VASLEHITLGDKLRPGIIRETYPRQILAFIKAAERKIVE
jgi:hypothetical protein